MRTTLIKLLFFLCLIPLSASAQTDSKSSFWEHVQFGGGLGLSIGSGYTDVTVAPGAIYNFNQYIATGIGLQGSYVKVRDSHDAWIYGGSLLILGHPVPEIQLSAELEQVRVNSTVELIDGTEIIDNFWNTALFLGAGYRIDNVTIGVRYNVLFDEDSRVYGDAFMPFVRAYF